MILTEPPPLPVYQHIEYTDRYVVLCAIPEVFYYQGDVKCSDTVAEIIAVIPRPQNEGKENEHPETQR